MKKIQKTALAVMALALGAPAARFVRADAPANPPTAVAQATLSDLARLAIDADPKVSKPAIEKLRAAGPAGLDTLLDTYKTQVMNHRNSVFAFSSKAPHPTWPRVTAALDAVAAQRNA